MVHNFRVIHTLVCWRQELTIVYHVLLDYLGQGGSSDSVGGTAVLSLLSLLSQRMLETKINHSISRITGLFGTRRGFCQCWRHCSVVTLSLLSLAFLWLHYFCPDSAGSTAGLSLHDHFSWPFCGSAASGDSLSLAPASPLGCSRGRLVRRFSR
jgi:hypothetical protein